MPDATKFWCFTLNNPTEDDEQIVTDFLSSGDVTYGIIGREAGASGTPHLQGFVILDRSRRRSYLVGKFQAHFTVRYHGSTNEQARDYCKKEGDYEEFGEFPKVAQGKRNDLEQVVQWHDAFVQENGRAATPREFALEYPLQSIRYSRMCEVLRLRAPSPCLQVGEPNDWQKDLYDRLEDTADDRTIDFVVDPEGGKGKTWFCRWMMSQKPDKVQILSIAKKEDLAYMLDETKTIFLFNVPRGQMEYLSYPLLECMKDRMVISGKYGSRLKTWMSPVHVVVLSNEWPEEKKLTEGRCITWNI